MEPPAEQPARAALLAPPQPELIASASVGPAVTKVNVQRPTGQVVKVIRPRS